ncbi:hypothetical protein AAMO2058_000023200 [Amorphochlora amoebiformis]
MNQQRQRRFKSAMEAKLSVKKLRAQGIEIKDDEIFDSNCITPGTEFMARLCHHLRYFVRKKMQQDAKWRRVRVILSGPDVPGEGEHKIMMYIRRAKMLPGYKANVRHCMYGLDADLIMLALVTHEPHFALLREEVIFGRPKKEMGFCRKAVGKMDEFQLLHISVLREYIDVEFNQTPLTPGEFKWSEEKKHDKPARKTYSVERIMDDWIAICMLVGNDFIPNVPMLDIAENGLDAMILAYKTKVLPKYGHLMESNRLRYAPFCAFLDCLSEITGELWEKRVASGFKPEPRGRRRRPDPPEFTPEQMKAMKSVSDKIDGAQGPRGLANRGFSSKENLTYYKMKFKDFFIQPNANHQVMSPEYLMERIRQLCVNYLEGLTWVIRYYYEGCCSWGWFYPYFYAPMCEELSSLLQPDDFKSVTNDFQEGSAYRPLEQLLSVLPPHSKALLPKSVRPLVESGSAIASYYPPEFSLDSNFKTTPWEAIALIPFIDERTLLGALEDSGAFARLTKEETKRNRRIGTNYVYSYDSNLDPTTHEERSEKKVETLPLVKATLRGFPDIHNPVSRESPWEFPEKRPFRPQIVPGTDRVLPGFPCLRLFRFTSKLIQAGVNIFGRSSSKPSLVLALPGIRKGITCRRLAEFLLGDRTCFVAWPFLREALAVTVFDEKDRYERKGKGELKHAVVPASKSSVVIRASQALSQDYLTKKAVQLAPSSLLVSVRLFQGMARQPDGRVLKTFSRETVTFPAATILTRNPRPEKRYDEKGATRMKVEFSPGSSVIYIGDTPKGFKGSIGRVIGVEKDTTWTVELKIAQDIGNTLIRKVVNSDPQYFSPGQIAKSINISSWVISQITSSVITKPHNDDIGLQLKSTKHQKIVPGYTRINPLTGKFEYSTSAVHLIFQYRQQFPQVFYALQNKRQGGDFLNISDLVPRKDIHGFQSVGSGDQKTQDVMIDSIKKFLNSLPTANLFAFPASSVLLSPVTIRKLEETIEQKHPKSSVPPSTKHTMKIPKSEIRRSLYRASPEVWWTPTPGFALGDRVVCLRNDQGIPLGAKGTVVGIHADRREGGKQGSVCGLGAGYGGGGGVRVDVLLDYAIVAGSDLQLMCSKGHGKSIAASGLLNLSKARQSASSYHDSAYEHLPVTPLPYKIKNVEIKTSGNAKSQNWKNQNQTHSPVRVKKGVPQIAKKELKMDTQLEKRDKNWATIGSNAPFCQNCAKSPKTPQKIPAEPQSQRKPQGSGKKVLNELFAKAREQERNRSSQQKPKPFPATNPIPFPAKMKSPENGGKLAKGTEVVIVGLTKKREKYNGRKGSIIQFRTDLNRYVVKLGRQEMVALKSKHISILSPSPSQPEHLQQAQAHVLPRPYASGMPFVLGPNKGPPMAMPIPGQPLAYPHSPNMPMGMPMPMPLPISTLPPRRPIAPEDASAKYSAYKRYGGGSKLRSSAYDAIRDTHVRQSREDEREFIAALDELGNAHTDGSEPPSSVSGAQSSPRAEAKRRNRLDAIKAMVSSSDR